MSVELATAETAAGTWTLRDYVSPGLRVVRPDAAFPHMRAGDALHHPWKYLRRDVPHLWYCDERFPQMGFLNRDEATLLHNIALQFAGRRALEIGSWLGWSTCHLALGGVVLDVIDPAHDDPVIHDSIQSAVTRCGVADRVRLVRGRSPESIAPLGQRWSLFFIDGDHEGAGPLRDAMACLPYAEESCAFVFHDLAAPAVAAGLRFLRDRGFETLVYQTAQIMGIAWRGDVRPVGHTPDPEVAWQMPPHLAGFRVSGVDYAPRQNAAVRQLREVFADDPALNGSPNVCLVTGELIGPFRNGGIGTANSGLAEALAEAGARVTVLYTGGAASPQLSGGTWRKRYAERGITVDALTIDDAKHLTGPVAESSYVVPWLVHQYLAARRFDVVHFNDCCGDGSLALAAKSLGVAFHDTLLIVGLHSPSRWVIDANQTLASPLLAAFDYAERLTIASADVLWSPSQYLVEWIAERRFRLPEQTFVQQYAMPAAISNANTVRRDPMRVDEIVFFGRLEERKGLRVFCNAIHALRDELASRRITVTFLGKPERCGGIDSVDYLARRRKSWRFSVRTISSLGQPEALASLRRDGVLAVMPSPVDNSPCTVYEALALGIPFIASRTGGIPELIAPQDRDRVLFEYGTEGLRNALRHAIDNGAAIATPAIAQDETRRAWRAMHAHWRELLPRRDEPAPRRATVAVVIDHGAGAAIDATLHSLWRCASSVAVNRIVILNRSGESLPLPSIDLTTADVDAVVAEVAAITEDVVLLIHSGVAVVPNSVERMLRALDVSGADGLQPACRITSWTTSEVIPPLGGSVPFSLFAGPTFTGALMMRRDALLASQDGKTYAAEAPFLGLADFCVTSRERILPYPEIAVERDVAARIDANNAASLRVALYENVAPDDRHYIVASGYAASQPPRGSARRALARIAVTAGFSFGVRIAAAAWRRARLWRR